MNYTHYYAIIPFYGEDGGNCTRIIYSDGTKEIVEMPIKSYLHKLYGTIHLDPKVLQFWTHNVLGTKCNTPITLTEQLVFIPVKVRQTFGKSDGRFAYILSHVITDFDDCTLTLDNGICLQTLSPKTYVTKKLRDARLLAYAYQDQRKKYEFLLHNLH